MRRGGGDTVEYEEGGGAGASSTLKLSSRLRLRLSVWCGGVWCDALMWTVSHLLAYCVLLADTVPARTKVRSQPLELITLVPVVQLSFLQSWTWVLVVNWKRYFPLHSPLGLILRRLRSTCWMLPGAVRCLHLPGTHAANIKPKGIVT